MTRPRTQTESVGKDTDTGQARQRKDRAPEDTQDTSPDTDADNFIDPRGNTGVAVAKTGDATDPSAAGGLATKETTRSDR